MLWVMVGIAVGGYGVVRAAEPLGVAQAKPGGEAKRNRVHKIDGGY